MVIEGVNHPNWFGFASKRNAKGKQLECGFRAGKYIAGPQYSHSCMHLPQCAPTFVRYRREDALG